MGNLKYKLTTEHEAQLRPWAEKWIANAMSTAPMDDEEREEIRTAIKGLYMAAKLEPPPDHRIVFVPSPMVGRFAAGYAAWIWYCRKNGKGSSRDATDAATADATYDATDAAIDERQQWYIGAEGCARVAKAWRSLGLKSLASCANSAWRLVNGGNQWSGWVAFLSFFRHVAKLDIDYSAWSHYETAAKAGPRFMHEKFCIVSERPEVLLVDDDNQPHCDDGPFCCWRDGVALYSFHGVRVPAWVVESPERITLQNIRTATNAEVRRVMRERYGDTRYFAETGSKIIDSDHQPVDALVPNGKAIGRMLIEDDEQNRYLVASDGSTERVYSMRVPNNTETCQQAHDALTGKDQTLCVGRS